MVNVNRFILIISTTATMIFLTISLYFAMNKNFFDKEIYQSRKRIGIINTDNYNMEDLKPFLAKKGYVGDYNVHNIDPPINPVSISLNDWNRLAKFISSLYDQYDAFIVITGHDTLPYTACAMSFMLEYLSKPVVFADKDIYSALILTSSIERPEVMVATNGKLTRACRTIVRSTESLLSPNSHYLSNENLPPLPEEHMKVKYINPNLKIAVAKLFPGFTSKNLQQFLESKVNAIILEVWCTGSAPITNSLLKAINTIVNKGIIIVITSQCDTLSNYQVDPRLLEAGGLSGKDMTTPAVYAKLAFLISNVKDRKLLGPLIEQNLRGEIS